MADALAPAPRPLAARPLAWTLAVAAASLALTCGHFLREANADGLLPVLISLQKWTPFYWGQKHYGQLVPLLAVPFRTPLSNLVAQFWMLWMAAVGEFFVLPYYLLRRPGWALAGALVATLYVAFGPPYLRWDTVIQPYAIGFALGGLALCLLEGGRGWRRAARVAGAVVLLVAAYFVSSTVLLQLAPLVAARALLRYLEPGGREQHRAIAIDFAVAAGVVIFLGAASNEILKHFPDGNPYLELTPRATWVKGWTTLVARTWTEELAKTPWPVLAGLLTLAGVGLQARPRSKPRRAGIFAACVLLLLGAVGFVVVAGVNEWVRRNLYAPRYCIPPLILVHAAIALLWADTLGELELPSPRLALASATAALLAGSVWSYGWPSIATVRADRAAATPGAKELADAGVTHIVGDYWRVWPLVLEVNQLLRERGESRQVWGVTSRSEDTADLWGRVPESQVVVGVPAVDAYWGMRMAQRWGRAPASFERIGPVLVSRPH